MLLRPWGSLGMRHCVKSVQIRSFFWSIFSCIQSKYRKIQTRKNSVSGHFSGSERLIKVGHKSVFRTQSNIYDGVFLRKDLTVLGTNRVLMRGFMVLKNIWIGDMLFAVWCCFLINSQNSNTLFCKKDLCIEFFNWLQDSLLLITTSLYGLIYLFYSLIALKML